MNTPPPIGHRVGIIGTAGRGDDRSKLGKDSYTRMYNSVLSFLNFMKLDPTTIQVVSGGAAWADHLAVSLVMNHVIAPEQLTLYLPVALTTAGYRGENSWTEKVASTANYYHRLFSQTTGRDSIRELNHVCGNGSQYRVISGGFKARNLKVAEFLGPDDHLLAFTFGNDVNGQLPWTLRSFLTNKNTNHIEGGLKDGGTAHTWDSSQCYKYHARLGFMGNSGND